MWVTFCLNDNQREHDEEEVFEEILDRVKRDAMPQPKGMHFVLAVYIKNARLDMVLIENTSNETLYP